MSIPADDAQEQSLDAKRWQFLRSGKGRLIVGIATCSNEIEYALADNELDVTIDADMEKPL
jgi:hypothetical protein